MKVYVYNGDCACAGLPVPNHLVEQNENPDKSKDWTVYEGSDGALRAVAIFMARAGGCYRRQIAKTLLAATGLSDSEISRIVYGSWEEKCGPGQSALVAEQVMECDRRHSDICRIDSATADVPRLLVPCGDEEVGWA